MRTTDHIRTNLDHARRRLHTLTTTAHLHPTWEQRHNAHSDANAERVRIAWLERDLADAEHAERQQTARINTLAAAARVTGQPIIIALAHLTRRIAN